MHAMCRHFQVAGFVLFLPLLFPQPNLAKDKNKDPEAIGNRSVGKGINFYSAEKEATLGRQLSKEMEFQSRILTDPSVTEYVNRLGQNLARNSDAAMPFTIKVIDSEEVNACAFPGGFLFVNVGLILVANSEAELAAAMAHEIAHVAARHTTRQATREMIADYGSLLLIFAGGQAGFIARQALSVGAPVGLAKFSRGFEGEADFLGLQYLYKAGYDPTAFVDLLERIEFLEPGKSGPISRLLSTHPLTRSRIRATQKTIQAILPPRSEYVVNTSEFCDIKARLLAKHAREHEAESYTPTLRVRTR